MDRLEVGTGQVAPPPLQSRRSKEATTGANKARNVTLDTLNVTLDQATARAERAARRASQRKSQNEQRNVETISAEIPRADTDQEDREQANTEATTEPELNTPTRGSRASEAARTPTWKKRGRPTPADDTFDTEREVTAKRDRCQGTKHGHSTMPASDVD